MWKSTPWLVLMWPGILFLAGSLTLHAQEAISSAKERPIGSVVTVRGVAINGGELGPVRYIQDSTAGIAVYPGTGSPQDFQVQVTLQTDVEVTGVLSQFRGLREINPILQFSVMGEGLPLPDPIETTLDNLEGANSGRLVIVRCLHFSDNIERLAEGANEIYSAGGHQSILFLQSGHPLVDAQTPAEPFDLKGIASYAYGTQLLVREEQDLVNTSCFTVVEGPFQDDLQPDAFRLTWLTSDEAQPIARIGTSPGDMEIRSYPGFAFDHQYVVDNLEPATFYKVQAGGVSFSTADTAWSASRIMTTSSTSSGDIDVYFNHPVDGSVSNGAQPEGTTFGQMRDALLNLISSAQSSIDVAMYNSNRNDLIAALEDARQQGVRVRYIADAGQSNGSLDPAPDFPVYFRNGDGIMHHKFIVVDPLDSDNAQVWTGSTNFSTNQLALDPNNSLHIRDQALAKAYLVEFEEIWGGSGDTPNAQQALFGAAKKDDTPHLFSIGGREVECYFSPSDKTNTQIIRTLRRAEETIDFALLLMTRFDIAQTLADRVSDGLDVRGILHDDDGSEGVIPILEQGGVRVEMYDQGPIFHHKYAILDAQGGQEDPTVLTGSHNWTTSATTRNDENTLIIHDADIANIYWQELEARWSQVSTLTRELTEHNFLIYPNPFSGTFSVETDRPVHMLTLYSADGKVVFVWHEEDAMRMDDIATLPSGAYLLRMTFKGGAFVNAPLIKLP